MGKFWHACFAALVAAGCNDSTTLRNPSDELGKREAAEADLAKSHDDGTSKPAKPDASGDAGDTDKPSAGDKPETGDTSGFDVDMADTVMKRAQRQAVQCPTVAKDTPTGEGDITVVFDGAKGSITDVNLGSTFTAGSTTGQDCLKTAFIGQKVPPFKGEKKVKFTLKVPPAAADPDKDKRVDGKKKKP